MTQRVQQYLAPSIAYSEVFAACGEVGRHHLPQRCRRRWPVGEGSSRRKVELLKKRRMAQVRVRQMLMLKQETVCDGVNGVRREILATY